MVRLKILSVAVILSLIGGWSSAATYYVAPPGAATGREKGTVEQPFRSINSAIKSGKISSGDTVLLQDGYHGELVFSGWNFDAPVTVRSQSGKAARAGFIYVQSARNLVLKNLSVWPNTDTALARYQVEAGAGASDVTIDGFDIRGASDAGSYLSWSQKKWRSRPDGVVLFGARQHVRNTVVTGVNGGIFAFGDDSTIIDNRLEGYGADGLRALGNRTIVRGNRVENCVEVSGNHDDGFQSWAEIGVPGATVGGLVIDRNSFLEWTAAKSHPLRCRSQGIGLFDGFYDDLTITNNLVAVSEYHGISVFGARRAMIANNTVVNPDGINNGPAPWIGVYSHKNGTPSRDVIVINNVTNHINGGPDDANNVVFSDNALIINHAATFNNIAAFDFTPRPSSNLIDSAAVSHATQEDLYANPRAHGAGPDKGAIEAGVSGGS